MNETYVLGNVTEQRLSEIWHGERTASLRQALRHDDFSLGCQQCAWQGAVGTDSYLYARNYDRLAEHATDPVGWPVRLEMSLSNACNLQCQMCSGILSSSIRIHREKLPPLPKAYGDEFFADLRQFVPHLREATFAGGEPFMASECFRVWDLFIELNPAIACRVTTNGTHWNAKVERVLDALPMSVSVSIDGASKAMFEAVRVGADFDTVLANLDRFREAAESTHVVCCLMPENAAEVPDVIQLADDRDLGISVHYVTQPMAHSIDSLDRDEREALLGRMEERTGDLRLRRNGQVWTDVLDRVRRAVDDSYRSYPEFFEQSPTPAG
jgi:MoaA/NifB/PqqE/SkfB family radical SAM enzyme